MKKHISHLQIALKSVVFNWRMEVSVLLGTVLAAAVLVGALLVGDSVTYSLRRFALLRLGETRTILQADGRFFDAGLAAKLEREAGVPFAPALLLRGVVLMDHPNGDPTQVNHVQVIGVDPRFWTFAPGADIALTDERIAVNSKLATQLGAAPGAELSVRIGKPSLMPRDAPLSSRTEKLTKRGSFTLECVVPDEQLGRFSLSANQVAPYNVFVDMAWLQEAMDLPGKANLLMAGAASDGKEISPDQLAAALKRIWSPTDVGITLRSHGTISQMESDRVFLDPSASQAALSIDNSAGVLTYMVNRIQKGERSTPYSFAVACSPSDDKALSPVPVTMRDDQVIINEWLAQSLDAAPGDTITLSYYELEAGGGFTSRERAFTVLRVDTMADFEQEAELMPKFPGLTDVEQCRDWDVGLPMEKEALNDPANQDYWESYRATPKVVVTLAAGRDMWSNRFGDTTAVRFPTAKEAVQDVLTERIDPETVGLAPRPVREDALRAVTQAMSFGELFTAMSFFLIAAALMLTGMLFVFGIQQRAEEMGLLLGVGYRPSRVRAMYLCEGGLVALAGSIIGGLLGTGYTRMLVWGLADYWQGAVASSAIQYHAEARTIIDGIIGSFLCAMAAMTIAMWRQTKRPARELLSGDLTQGRPVSASRAACVRTRALSLAAAVAAGGAVLVARHAGHEHAVYAFFGAGFMLLLAGLGCSRLLLQRLALQPKAQLTITGLGARNASRRGGRSLTAVVLLASGCFLVFAVSAMQQDLAATAGERGSGSGGFSLLGQATIPLPDPLETDKGAALFGLEREPALTNASFVSLKVRDGDDASCFNLNRAQSPRLLGVDPQALEANGAFLPKGSEAHELWGLLDIDLPDGVIPGLAGDANTAMWNLEKKAHPTQGDEIRYRDELGNTFQVKLVGTLPMPLSIFQGTVLIAKSDFEMRYPSESGYRMFLVDLPATTNPTDATHALARRLDRMGVDVTTTLSRLLEFHGVEATYLNMFLILGGLGVVLGTLGLGIVVLRNMLERRSEFALLRCVGFSRQKILWLVLAEHWLLLVMGLVCGLTSAAVAIYPSLAAPGMHVPMQPIVLLLLGIVITGLGSTTLAVIIALRGELIPSLRRE